MPLNQNYENHITLNSFINRAHLIASICTVIINTNHCELFVYILFIIPKVMFITVPIKFYNFFSLYDAEEIHTDKHKQLNFH